MTTGGRVGLDSLTAVVLNWNQADLAIRSVEALVDDGMPPTRIVVVDNGSTDGSWERLSTSLRHCRRVRISENVGYAQGNNAGARALTGDAYLFVNSDAFVHRPGSVTALVRALERASVGVVFPRLLDESHALQPSVFPLPGPPSAFVRAIGLSRLVPDALQPRFGTHWAHGTSREIECAAGAVILVRNTTWAAVGGFPETAFMYAEETGLCLSAARLGWKAWFCADSEFTHLSGGSTGERWNDAQRAERIATANARLIRDHLPPLDRRLTLAFVRAGLIARQGYWTLAGKDAAVAECRALLRGYASHDENGEDDGRLVDPAIDVFEPDSSG